MSRSGMELCSDVRTSVWRVGKYLYGRRPSGRFKFDLKTQDAVIYRLIVIGESAKFLLRRFPAKLARHSLAGRQLSEVLMDAYGMRNVLVHQHWAVKLHVVRSVAKRDLQPLAQAIQTLESDL